ncbi:YaiO family outer membrane beta-barrel protein [Sphingomonas sp. LY29]|uniref:YaiO family outer membrane beta-barrel protein n=1 Tax=Sphingomonas sp. LY29 TaxID=3095341 RepID=UPI002D76A382|nr:YaiO family outer membrane beta-barrel protein [Sphingomonas sp. LY29]WRP26335.1 YaiO family outer membrane beta-barrel protein [Sphingomonas sp. LY29]
MTKNTFRLSACLMVLAAPAAAQAPQSPYAEGVAARRAGETQRAIELLAEAVRIEPGSADAQVQYGYALLAGDNLQVAEVAFRKALQLAPAYDDARVGLALVAERRGDMAGAAREISTVPSSNVEANSLRRRLARARPLGGWSVGIDASVTAIEGSEDWKQLDLDVAKNLSDGSRVAGRVELASRFGETDTYGELRFDKSLDRGRGVYVFAGATPDALFRPKWQIGGGGRVRVIESRAPTVLTLDMRRASYITTNVTSISPGVEQYLVGGRAWLTARSINITQSGSWSHGWLARADVMPSEKSRVFLGLSNAPDVDQGFVTRTRTWFLGASQDVGRGNSIRLSVSEDRPEIGRDRLTLNVGTTVRLP